MLVQERKQRIRSLNFVEFEFLYEYNAKQLASSEKRQTYVLLYNRIRSRNPKSKISMSFKQYMSVNCTVFFQNETMFDIPTEELKRRVSAVVRQYRTEGVYEVTVVLADDDTMVRLAEDFLDEEDTLHDVLSFPYSETKPGFRDEEELENNLLGEIAISYTKAAEEAREMGKDPTDWILELAEHGTLHLLGIHHE